MPQVPISEQDKARHFAGEDLANPDPRAAALRQEIRERTEFAKVRPQIGRMIATEERDIRVGSFDPAETLGGTVNPSPEAPTTWHVYERDGNWLAEVRLPSRFRLFAAGRDWVIGVRRDADDIERVELYMIQR